MARWEGRAVRRTAATVALTAEDARRLAALAGRPDRVRVVPAPFPDRLPDAGRSLPGEPPVVVLGSAGWPPNRDGLRWLAAAWPRVRTVLPAARLHVFGSDLGAAVPAGDASIVVHPPPADSRQAFAPGSVLVVPLRVASGVRMKILEAWARGVPVVATPEAARGLDAEDGRQLLLAATAEQLARALERLRREPALAGALVREGREILRRRHALPLVAGALMRLWTETLRTER
ncbi:MAG: glycosyltransferase [Acidobacteria bacterium]|nr:MAG: glycosyltransferase [Acidobacteriota bacterium]